MLRRLDLPTNARLIGTASRFTSSKSIRDFLFAAALLRLAHDDLRFVICGDGPAAAEVRTFCERMRMTDLTVFPGARLDAAELIGQFTVYVDAAVADGPSRGIAEAQRSGVPVVCVDTPILLVDESLVTIAGAGVSGVGLYLYLSNDGTIHVDP